MIGIVIGAATLGIIIAVMEQDEFPGWGKMILCVLAAGIPGAIVNALLPPELFFIGLLVGGVCGTLAIFLTCGMTLQRAAIAGGIYVALQAAISTGLYFMMR